MKDSNGIKIKRAQYIGLRTALGYRNFTPNFTNIIMTESKVMDMKDRAYYLARNFILELLSGNNADLKSLFRYSEKENRNNLLPLEKNYLF